MPVSSVPVAVAGLYLSLFLRVSELMMAPCSVGADTSFASLISPTFCPFGGVGSGLRASLGANSTGVHCTSANGRNPIAMRARVSGSTVVASCFLEEGAGGEGVVRGGSGGAGAGLLGGGGEFGEGVGVGGSGVGGGGVDVQSLCHHGDVVRNTMPYATSASKPIFSRSHPGRFS